jgi:hypothetical protein
MSAFFDAGRRVLSSGDQEVGMKEVAPTAAGHARVISGSVQTEIPMGENRHGPQERERDVRTTIAWGGIPQTSLQKNPPVNVLRFDSLHEQ